MAIQFPPVNVGDPEPQDGDTYLYLINQKEFVCRRSTVLEAAQWAEKGVVNTTSFGYRGGLEIQNTAPTDAVKGNIYSVIDGGVAHTSFLGLAGDNIGQWSLILFSDPGWILICLLYTSPSPRDVEESRMPSSA